MIIDVITLLSYHIHLGDYIRQYPNFRHDNTNGHNNTIGLAFRYNKLKYR